MFRFLVFLFLTICLLELVYTHPIQLQQASYLTFFPKKIKLRIDLNFSGAPAMVLRNYLTNQKREIIQKRQEKLKTHFQTLFSFEAEGIEFSFLDSQIDYQDNPTNYKLKNPSDLKDYPCFLTYTVYFSYHFFKKNFKIKIKASTFSFPALPLSNLFDKNNLIVMFRIPLKELSSNLGRVFKKSSSYFQIYDLILTPEKDFFEIKGEKFPLSSFKSSQLYKGVLK